jgi:hypothetical protein
MVRCSEQGIGKTGLQQIHSQERRLLDNLKYAMYFVDIKSSKETINMSF